MEEQVINIPISDTQQTISWQKTCSQGQPCETVHQWHKYAAIAGEAAYPGAWEDFDAGIHGYVHRFEYPINIRKINLQYVSNSGQLYIWGIHFE